MSYEIVKGLSINLNDLSAVFRSSSNNVFPKSYSPFTYTFKRHESYSPSFTDKELFILSLIKDVDGGSLKLQPSVSTKVRWAFLKTSEAFYSHPDILKFEYGLYSFIDKAVYGSSNVGLAKEIVQSFVDYFNKKDVRINKVVYLNNYQSYLLGTHYSRIRGMRISYANSLDHAKRYISQKELELLENDLKMRFPGTPYELKDLIVTVDNVLTTNNLFSEAERER